MAPARKKQRVQVVERKLSASEGNENTSCDPVPPVSVLKDTVTSFPSLKPLPSTDDTGEDLRRKTYFIHGGGTSDENEPCIVQHDQVETSSTVDDHIRRLTYVVTPFPDGREENSPMNCNPGIEMIESEMEITGKQLQPPTPQDSKPKKRGRKKKSDPTLQENSKVMESENADAKKETKITNAPSGSKPRKRAQKKSASTEDAQVKTLETEKGTEISTVKTKGRKKKVQDQENENIPTGSNMQKKPVKRGKKKNAD